MVSVSEAKKLIKENCLIEIIKEISLIQAVGFVIAEKMYAPFDTPHFNQSAMDGYAFSFEDWDKTSDLEIIGEVQAGNVFQEKISAMKAVRIFTGAALPKDVDTVVIQENVIRTDNTISIKNDLLKKGNNIRLIGSQTKKGELIAEANQIITPATISFLASFGIYKIKVYYNPSISIITTGKELLQQNEQLTEGKIYESNSYTLIAALQQMNISPTSVQTVDDDEAAITKTIRQQLQSNIVLITGGISVGDYDFVSSALEKCGVKKIFHKVKQKPGKPFYFGTFGQTLIFALPGNPASVLSCFYEYVVEAIGFFSKKNYYKKLQLPLANDYSKKRGLTFFLKGKIQNNSAFILSHQESYKMNSFAEANCLIELAEDKENYFKNDIVNVLMLN